MTRILDAVRDEFFSRLQTNTTWGRNQIKELYTQCERDVLVKEIEEINGKVGRDARLIAENSTFGNLRQPIVSIYNRGTAAYNQEETPDYGDDNPFHDDKDINKG